MPAARSSTSIAAGLFGSELRVADLLPAVELGRGRRRRTRHHLDLVRGVERLDVERAGRRAG